MIDIVGFADVEKIVKAFGGVTFRFTDGLVYFPRLVELIGMESAVKLRDYFRYEHVYVPRCEMALRMLKGYQFKADYDYLTKIEKKSGRVAMMTLCPKYKISDRTGWKLIKNVDCSAQQESLF
ncbi:mor transcription activator family protein [Actinobacillus sp. GY-402]|nr:mor transcription activator family protein [Actinobacillus sp. GY-402]